MKKCLGFANLQAQELTTEMSVSHSHIRTKKLQQANLQQRRLWWEEENKWINIRVTTRALKTIQKKGLGKYAKSLGVDLNKL